MLSNKTSPFASIGGKHLAVIGGNGVKPGGIGSGEESKGVGNKGFGGKEIGLSVYCA